MLISPFKNILVNDTAATGSAITNNTINSNNPINASGIPITVIANNTNAINPPIITNKPFPAAGNILPYPLPFLETAIIL